MCPNDINMGGVRHVNSTVNMPDDKPDVEGDLTSKTVKGIPLITFTYVKIGPEGTRVLSTESKPLKDWKKENPNEYIKIIQKLEIIRPKNSNPTQFRDKVRPPEQQPE